MGAMALPAPAAPSSATPAAEAQALRRAARSLRCLPFRRAFYQQVDGQAMAAKDLCTRSRG